MSLSLSIKATEKPSLSSEHKSHLGEALTLLRSQPTGYLKTRHVTMSLLTSMTGVGILTFPKIVDVLGLGLGLSSIFIIGLSILYLSSLMSQAIVLAEQRVGRRVKSIVDLGEICFGKFGKFFVLFLSITKLLGNCACLLILIGKYTDMCFSASWVSNRAVILLVSPLALSAFLRDLSKLEKLAPLSAGISLLLPVVMSGLSLSRIYTSGVRKNIRLAQNWENLLPMLTSILFAYNFMVVMPTLRSTMIKPKKIWQACFWNIAIGGSLYLIASFSTYLGFGEVKSDFVDNLNNFENGQFSGASWSGAALALTIACSCFLTFPLLMNVLCQMLEDFTETKFLSFYNICLRVTCVLVSFVSALLIPRFELLVSLLGATVLCCMNLILPVLIFRKMAQNWGVSWRFYLNLSFLFFGIILLVVGTRESVYRLLNSVDSRTHFFQKLYPRS